MHKMLLRVLLAVHLDRVLGYGSELLKYVLEQVVFLWLDLIFLFC